MGEQSKLGQEPAHEGPRALRNLGWQDQIYMLPGLLWLQDREVDGRESEKEDQAEDKQ